MKIFRFMSKNEFEKYRSGEILENKTIHQGRTNSIGFCFFNIDDVRPERAMHFLSGVATLDICAVFETNKKLNKTKGTYAKLPPSTGNVLIDYIRILNGLVDRFDENEYCTTEYSNKDFKLLKYSEDIWQQWKPGEEESKIVWKEGVVV